VNEIAPKKRQADEYMNWLRHAVISGNVGYVTSEGVKTGCNVRAGIAMLIHQIAYVIPMKVSEAEFNVGWSSKDLQGETSVDNMMFGKKHVIDFAEHVSTMTTDGAILEVQPKVHHFDPPIIYAEPEIWLNAWHSTVTTQGVTSRIGFTYKILTPTQFIEVLESYR
jgi:hypothetical protein